VQWWHRAAEVGYAKAQHNLAIMYENGLGVPQDHDRAFAWLSIAASGLQPSEVQEREKVLETLSLLASKMTPAQIAQEKATAQEWKQR
jgi:TPR repeat protein